MKSYHEHSECKNDQRMFYLIIYFLLDFIRKHQRSWLLWCEELARWITSMTKFYLSCLPVLLTRTDSQFYWYRQSQTVSENDQDSISVHLHAKWTVYWPQEVLPLLSNNSCFSGSEEKRWALCFLSVLFLDVCCTIRIQKRKKTVAKVQAKFLVIMTSPPCGPISLHLKVTLPSHQHSQPPIATATHLWLSCSMFTAFIPLIKKAVMGSGCGTFIQAMTAALVNRAACRRLTWWGRLRCQGANKADCPGRVQQILVLKYNSDSRTDILLPKMF